MLLDWFIGIELSCLELSLTRLHEIFSLRTPMLMKWGSILRKRAAHPNLFLPPYLLTG